LTSSFPLALKFGFSMRRCWKPRHFFSLFAFLYTFSVFAATPVEGFSKLTYGPVLGLLSAALLLIARGRLALVRDPVALLFLAFAGLSLAGGIWAQDVSPIAVSTAISASGALLLLIALWNGASVRWAASGAVIGAVVTGAVAARQFLQEDALRATGLTGNANLLAVQLIIAAVLVVFIAPPHKRPRYILFAALLILAGTVFSGSRKAVLAVLVLALSGLFGVIKYVSVSRSRIAALLLSVPLTVGSFVALTLIAPNALPDATPIIRSIEGLEISRRTATLFARHDGSRDERLLMIGRGLELWQESPIWGHGTAQFTAMSGYGTYSHNNYVELLANFGLVGFITFYTIHVAILVRSCRRRSRRPIIIAAVFVLLAWDFALVSHTGRLFWVFLAILAFGSRPNPFPRGRVRLRRTDYPQAESDAFAAVAGPKMADYLNTTRDEHF
jgi:O-antigen ligase